MMQERAPRFPRLRRRRKKLCVLASAPGNVLGDEFAACIVPFVLRTPLF